MNKKLKTGLWLMAIAVIIAMVGNIGFAIFNTVATPMTNDLALGQMTSGDAVADTMGRISAEGKIWGIVQFICDGAAFIVGIIGLTLIVKSQFEREKEKA